MSHAKWYCKSHALLFKEPMQITYLKRHCQAQQWIPVCCVGGPQPWISSSPHHKQNPSQTAQCHKSRELYPLFFFQHPSFQQAGHLHMSRLPVPAKEKSISITKKKKNPWKDTNKQKDLRCSERSGH